MRESCWASPIEGTEARVEIILYGRNLHLYLESESKEGGDVPRVVKYKNTRNCDPKHIVLIDNVAPAVAT